MIRTKKVKDMKKHFFTMACAIAAMAFTACDDYDIIQTEYDDMLVNPERQTVTPPDVDADWQLELIPDVGRQADNVFVYKDLKYNNIFSRTTGWNGGCGGISTLLPDGSILWAFNDSYFGVVDAAERTRLSGNVPLNMLLVQRAHNGKVGETPADLIALADYVNWTDPNADGYLYSRTFMRHPNAKGKTEEAIARGEVDGDQAYRIGGAVVADGKVQMLWRGARVTTDNSNGVTMTQHSLSGAIPEGRYGTAVNDYKPQSGDFLAMAAEPSHLFITGSIPTGQAVLADADGHSYIYGVSGQNIFVARSQTHDLTSPWEYYVRDATTGVMRWQTTFPTADEVARSNIMANGYLAVHPTIFCDNGTYYMLTQAVANSTEVYLYSAAAPTGPFDNQVMLFNLPSFIDKVGITTYAQIGNVFAHPELSRSGELVVSACTKAGNTADNYTYAGSADFTRPFFFRIFNWKAAAGK